MSDKNFTTWKLQTADALMTGLPHREFRVAFFVLQMANPDSREIYPSQAHIAHMLDMSPSSVERAISDLVKLGAIERVRENRQKQNRYFFVEERLNGWTDEREFRRAAWRETRVRSRRSDPADVMPQDREDPADVRGTDPADVRSPDPADVRAKHLKGTLEEEHSIDSARIEGGEVLSPEVGLGASAAPKASAPRQGRVTGTIPITDSLRASAMMQKRDPIASLNAMFGDDEAA